MANRKAYTFWIDSDLDAGLKALKARDAAPESESIRRALRQYLEQKGVLEPSKADRKRASTRKRS